MSFPFESNMTTEQIATTLRNKRTSLKGKLTLFKRFLDSCDETTDRILIRNRLSRITQHFTDVSKLHLDLTSGNDTIDCAEEEYQLEEEFDALDCRAQHLINDAIRASMSTDAANSPRSESANSIGDGDVKLPRINLPTFSGRFEDWPGFAEQFLSAVHDNSAIKEHKKLTYLRSCLTGEAAREIESVGNSAEHYPIAWSMLKKAFDRPAILVDRHISAIVSLSIGSKTSKLPLNRFLSEVSAHYRSLQTSGHLTVDAILIYLLTLNLDNDIVTKWKESKGVEFPDIDRFFDFIRQRCDILTPVNVDCATRQSERINKPNTRWTNCVRQTPISRETPRNTYVTQVRERCYICQGSHYTQTCNKLSQTNPRERIEIIKRLSLCMNCLRSGHRVSECSSSSCKRCNRRHHTILHLETQATKSSSDTRTDSDTERANSQVLTTCLNASVQTEVLLFTAVIKITDKNSQTHSCRVLLDSCAQSSFITEELANKLQLARTNIDIPVSGINQIESRITHKVETSIASRDARFKHQLTFLVVPTISDTLPSRYVDREPLEIPRNINLADPCFHKPAKIDGLIGAEIFSKLLCVGQISLRNGAVMLQKTRFGWVVSGTPHHNTNLRSTKCHLTRIEQLETNLANFWNIEEGIEQRVLSPEEAACERHYSNHTTRDKISGRYTVKLPFKSSVSNLGDSYPVALKRFRSLERSLNRNSEIKVQYKKFLREYLEQSHMRLCNSPDLQTGYFLPHHAVQKQSSLTTKLRVVFDASAHPNNGISLNEAMMTGPTIQDDIFSLVLRFRRHTYVLTADIAKMYRQILVHPSDRKYQRILWRENEDEPIRVYELNTVTYGTTSAPFLATRTLQQLADDEQDTFPEAAETLRNDFYVDDLLTGTDNYQDAIKLRDDLLAITKRGGFQLRQWASNDESLLTELSTRTDDIQFCLDTQGSTKTLGVSWNAQRDIIQYNTQTTDPIHRATKRTILSQIAQLYDPLGLVGPVVVKAKLIMQRLWQIQINWDESVPLEIFSAWCDYRNQLPKLQSLQIPRKLIIPCAQTVELHGFCDASERAYGACIYIKSCDSRGNVLINLASAKSRVAPLKTQTLPRLELCAAVLLTKLYQAASKALKIRFHRITFWSDSMITIQWINSPPHTLKTFVSNRVSAIQEVSTPTQWRHVPSGDNPADFISRGLNASQFLEVQRLWQTGPSWLLLPDEHWPISTVILKEIPEKRSSIALNTTVSVNDNFIKQFSSTIKAKRVIAYCLRFLHNCKNRAGRYTGCLAVTELTRAMLCIIRVMQNEAFPNEMRSLTMRQPIDKRSRLAPLSTFLDETGIIRVGGRIKHADLTFEQKHPIVLPSPHQITAQIIREIHLKHYHAGTTATLNALRQTYWPLNGRTTVKNVIRKCVRCQRAQPSVVRYAMGDLPQTRVRCQRPFLVCGVDYCGPFFIKERRHRNRTKVKVYIAIFVCFVTKAVHIELVEDLTTSAFLSALKRFFARRGRVTDIYSDNATTFVGANRELKELHEFVNNATHNNTIVNALANEGISWHFIPPRSPHFGGLWEAAVKSFKRHLLRVIGDATLSYEALLTCIVEIEAILNSRPLIPISSDPNDFTALTPGHFLIGDAITSMPERDLRPLRVARLSTWQHAQQMKQHFWSRWHKEYLHELTVRKRWHSTDAANIKIGSLVTIREDNISPMQWKLARISEVHPGADGVIRVVTLRTATGEYKRSVKLISPLLLDTE